MPTEVMLTVNVSETPDLIKTIEVLSRTITGMALDGISASLEVNTFEIVMGDIGEDEDTGPEESGV